MSTVVDAENPWPGLSAFDEAAERFFNGREAESAELLQLVGQSPLTVLFGKSGLGKTSLLQAGLFPRLRQQDVLPIYVRLDVRDRESPLVEQAAAALQAEFARHGVDAAAPEPGQGLWDYLHVRGAAWWSRRNRALTPLFVIDQFEEVFTLGAENAAGIERLRLDLADLIENRIPADLARRIESGAPAEHLDLRGQRYRLLLSFREDFLPEAESWKRDIPSLMRNRLRVLPMSAERALQVVCGKGSGGRTHELVSEEAARQIVRFVATAQTSEQPDARNRRPRGETRQAWEQLEIEPALLSLVASGLNERRKLQQQPAIDAALLESTGNTIIDDFYERCVADVPDRTRRFIEDALITEGGFRNSFPLQDALDQDALTEDLLRQLVDRRLLRIDHQLGVERVELIHDRLTSVVREHRDRERERRRVRRQRRQWWFLGSVVGGVVVTLGVIGIVLYQSLQQARAAKEASVAAYERAKAAEDKAQADRLTADARRAEAQYQAARATAERENAIAEAARADTEKQLAENATRRAVESLQLADKAKQAEARAAASATRSAQQAQAALRSAIAGKLVLHSRAILSGQHAETVERAVLLAAAAYRLQANDESLDSLQNVLTMTPGLSKVVGYPAPILGLSEDGRSLVTATGDSGVASVLAGDQHAVLQLWDAATGRQRGNPITGFRLVPSIAFSPDGSTFATGDAELSNGQSLRLWDAGSGRALGEPLRLGPPVQDLGGVLRALPQLAYRPDGKLIVASHIDRSLRSIDVAEWRETGTPMLGQAKPVTSLEFSRDGSMLASGDDNGLRLWDLAARKPLAEPLREDGMGKVLSIAFSPDGKSLLSNSSDGRLRLWDAGGAAVGGEALAGDASPARPLVFSPDGKFIVAGGRDGTLRVWDVDQRQRIETAVQAHPSAITALRFTGDRALVTVGADNTFRLWERSAWLGATPPAGHQGKVTSLAFSADGKAVVSAGNDGRLQLWDAASGEPRGDAYPGVGGDFSIVAFRDGGDTLVSMSGDGVLRLWDRRHHAPRGEPGAGVLGERRAAVSHAAFGPEGASIVVGGSNGTLSLVDTGSGQVRCDFLRTSPKGNLSIMSLAFSPDGRVVVSTVVGRVQVWDATTCEPRGATLFVDKGSTGLLTSSAISPDGKSVVAGGDSLFIWDAASGRLRSRSRGSDEEIAGVAFSPDGATIATASRNGALRLWDAASGQTIGTPMRVSKSSLTSVVFSPDGKMIASGDSQGRVHLSDSPAGWVDRVCTKVARNLSRAQFKAYAGDIDYVEQCPGLPIPPD